MGLLCLLWDQTGLEREVVKSGLMCLIVTGMKQNSQDVPSLHGGRTECSHRQDVGVICSSDLILLEYLLILLCKKVLLMENFQ